MVSLQVPARTVGMVSNVTTEFLRNVANNCHNFRYLVYLVIITQWMITYDLKFFQIFEDIQNIDD